MTSQDIKIRGKQAERLLNDPIYKESIQIIRDTLYNAFNKSKVSEDAEREKIYLMNHLLNELERNIQTVMKTGQYEYKVLEFDKQRGINNG